MWRLDVMAKQDQLGGGLRTNLRNDLRLGLALELKGSLGTTLDVRLWSSLYLNLGRGTKGHFAGCIEDSFLR